MKRLAILAAVGLWFVGVLAAFGLVWAYKTTPGPYETAPARWPVTSTIVPTAGRVNLVFFAHPQCPCTRASIAELARLAVEIGTRAQIHVVLVRPPGTDVGFEDGTLLDRARAIAGARIVIDDGGKQADLFGAKASGATVVYTAAGQLAFSGGLTTARGHEGRGPAHTRIVQVIGGAVHDSATAPTFGCELAEIETLNKAQ
jgi:hypothetical protein